MKIAGFINLALGVALALYNGFNYDSKAKIDDIGELEITANNSDYNVD